MSTKIIRFNGGFGNLLFQYAFGCAVGAGDGVRIQYDRTGISEKLWARMRWFIKPDETLSACQQAARFVLTGIPPIGRPRHQILSTLDQMGSGVVYQHALEALPEDGEIQRARYFSGYFQDQNLVGYIDQRKSAAFTEQVASWRGKLAAKFGDVPIISIHVRRGDYLDEQTMRVHGIITGDYYIAAIRRIIEQPCLQGKMPQLLVFTNGLADAKSMLNNLSIGPKLDFFADYWDGDDLVDFCAMTACDAHIVANSTFSYWAAALAANPHAPKIAPNKWFAEAAQNAVADQLFRSGWERV